MVTRTLVPMRGLRDEVQLYVTWLRGAVGPVLPADGPAPVPSPVRAEGREGAAPRATDDERIGKLSSLAADVGACRRCSLADSRTNTVFGEGGPHARLVVVGEAPGAEEDRTGRPFVGRAGELLTRMLAAIGLARDDVFICNVLKCRPPGNRSPRPDEAGACRPFLQAQIEVLEPALLLALGSHAARLLLRTERGITSLRGRFHTTPEGWRVMPSFHPAYLLRNPAAKREAWQDLQAVASDLGLDMP